MSVRIMPGLRVIQTLSRRTGMRTMCSLNRMPVSMCIRRPNMLLSRYFSDKAPEDFSGGQHQPQFHEAREETPEEKERLNQKMMISFTCTKCDHRLTNKVMSKRSYEKGVVLITCDSCKGIHLIADNLGWFDDESVNIEDIMREKGMSVKKTSDIMEFETDISTEQNMISSEANSKVE